jgi:putative ATP-dependent endonuclease of OLD family
VASQLSSKRFISLHPHLFNAEVVKEYINGLALGEPSEPPKIRIELYFEDDAGLAHLKGTNNSARANVPGVTLSIEFNDDYSSEFSSYVFQPERVRTLPVEYYIVRWRSFADNDVTARSILVKPSFIDASTIRNNIAANRYVVDIIRDSLSATDRVELALAYRLMKNAFLDDPKVKGVNDALATRTGEISEKAISLSLDGSSRGNWETGVLPHLDDVPINLVGKGEQNSVKIKLALASSAACHVVLVEEAENHLSYANLNSLIGHIAQHRGTRQLLITTHSSFVLNKLGVESVVLFNRGLTLTLKALSADTHEYFLRLPGHDTLRLILAERAILVEGPSDELIVQAAYRNTYGKLPLQDRIDVISVNSLAFKRFLEIAVILGSRVAVVTDNDGRLDALREKYQAFEEIPTIGLFYDADTAYPTLEPQLLKANGRAVVEEILGRRFASDEALLKHMHGNKADVALKFFTTTVSWTIPNYIIRAIS